MTQRILVQIIGAPIACADGVKDTWREVAAWAAGQLTARFGEVVHVDYYDLFDLGAPPVPPGARLPVVLVGGEVVSDAGLTPQSLKHDPDLLLRRVLLPGCPADRPHSGFRALLLLGRSASR